MGKDFPWTMRLLRPKTLMSCFMWRAVFLFLSEMSMSLHRAVTLFQQQRGQNRCEWEGESLKYTEEEFDTSVWPQLRQSGVVLAASSALKPPPHCRHVTRFLFSRKRTSVVCFYHFLPQPLEQVGSCWSLVAGGRKGNSMYDRKTESSFYGNISDIAMGTGAAEHALSRI